MQQPFRSVIRAAFSLKEDTASHEEIRERIIGNGKVTGTNLCVLVLAMLIASVGLNTNSTAVIIGAMLISPLMGSILAMAYGAVSVNTDQFKRSAYGFLFQILLSVTASTIYFLLSPRKEATSELLARTTPGFYDVMIAVCGGLAGIIGQTRKDRSGTVIPGVAIATALMPPLCPVVMQLRMDNGGCLEAPLIYSWSILTSFLCPQQWYWHYSGFPGNGIWKKRNGYC